MPGLKLLTHFDPPTCVKVAWRAAQDLGYALTPIDDGATCFTASKGSALLSVVPFMPPKCVFQVAVVCYPDCNEVVVERNEPWVTSGKIGVNRVKQHAEELVGAIVSAIEKAGGKITERKEF